MAQELLQSLNDQQRAAVTHEGPPLVVLSGPGTGKTRVIVHRIAHLIKERGADPASIVAATFTVKAAGELKARLAELLGAQVAQGVRASTLHGLASMIVRRFADVVGLPARGALLDPALGERILREVILQDNLFASSAAEGIGSLTGRLRRAFGGMADRGIAPQQAVAFARKWEAAGPSGDDDAAREADRALMLDFRDTARAYGAFVKRCRARGLFSFGDLVLLAIEALRRDSGVRAVLRSELRHFVIDEFQDCDAAQLAMLRELCGEGAGICVVGDDDQAIYGFRGSDDRCFQRFETLWPGPTVIELATNYRSTHAIVRVTGDVIRKAGVRYRPDKHLRAGPDAAAGPEVDLVRLGHEHDDGQVIAAMILDQRAQALSRGDSVRLAEFAVIARTHTDLERIAAALSLEGLAWSRRREVSPLEDDGVKDVLAWARWVLDDRAAWAARRVLSRPPVGADPLVLADWERAFVARRAIASNESQATPGLSAFLAERVRATEPAQPDWAVRVRAALALLADLRAAAATRPAFDAISLIVERTGVAGVDLLPSRERADRVRALVTVLSLARDRRESLEEPGDLASFLRYLDVLAEVDRDFESLRWADESGLGNSGANASEDEIDAVQLLTAHGAKGLEFRTVFVPHVGPRHGYPKRGGDARWECPPGLYEELAGESEDQRRADEERRMFYVACTRAREQLVILAKHGRKPAKSDVNYFRELWFEAPPDVPIRRREQADVLKDAAGRGVGVFAATGVEDAGAAADARSRLARMRSRVRVAAGAALERAGSATSPDEFRAALQELERDALRLAILDDSRLTLGMPAWALEEDKALANLAAHVSGLGGEEIKPAGVWAAMPPPPAPLRLTFTKIQQFEDCPRCWYMRFVLGLEDEPSAPQAVGTAAHEALEAFYKQWAAADAEGSPLPGVDALLGLGESALARAAVGLPDFEHQRRQLHAQLTAFMATLHDPQAHMLEAERMIIFPFAVDGVEHGMAAKIDRVDMAEGGALRVVDYKTGRAGKSLTQPAPDDLQLCVYRWAVEHAHGDAAQSGRAEYWCLATGERGVLPFQDMKMDKVRERIASAVRGMLAGRYERAKDCGGLCEMLGE